MNHFGTPNPTKGRQLPADAPAPSVSSRPGRYIISQEAAIAAHAKAQGPDAVVIHDTHHLSEQCNTDAIKHKSHFGDLAWAIGKGYRPCEHCLTTSGDHPADET